MTASDGSCAAPSRKGRRSRLDVGRGLPTILAQGSTKKFPADMGAEVGVVVVDPITALTCVEVDGVPERAGVVLGNAVRLSEQAAPTSATQVNTTRAPHARAALS